MPCAKPCHQPPNLTFRLTSEWRCWRSSDPNHGQCQILLNTAQHVTKHEAMRPAHGSLQSMRRAQMGQEAGDRDDDTTTAFAVLALHYPSRPLILASRMVIE